jgi:NADH:ubiquinone oxidoreductase subunit 6 (subunit J)
MVKVKGASTAPVLIRRVSRRGARWTAIMASIVMKTLYIAGSIAVLILFGIILLNVHGAATLDAEYLEFALGLTMFLVILIGSYWFVVRGPGRYM